MTDSDMSVSDISVTHYIYYEYINVWEKKAILLNSNFHEIYINIYYKSFRKNK